ncbi:MAG TPA: BREX-1 system adenine-specific DNA-methyltransferase PglX [Terriglobia bacterium]|nr:BREX-1 system adenine-specific DNA-methyltransferase PglX [Terriglobia bacterium]
MDQEIRNKLRNVVTQCRKLLEDSVSQELEGKYVIFARKDQVTADPNAKMTHLTEEEQAARKDILDHFGHIKVRGFKPKEALDQLVREIAFTHLNRLCVYKMMEAREVYSGGQKFREAVSRGINSNGVKFYLADNTEEERWFNTGHQDIAYRHFLDWLGGLLSEEIGVLFNPNDPANRLYPRQKTLDEVLELLNGGGIKAEENELREEWPKIWSQDETIGWVYQYFTPKELRDQARKDSQAPRNSYELAFRNQFFTPRYVVEFLTDNTLGRIWYEMRKGDTKLKGQCRYMVRRPTEIFLKEGEQPPKDAAQERDDLAQEELLKLPVHIPHRPKEDPRELKILDPACGSAHFLLYCFNLLLTIYEEAYADPDLGPALQKDYPKLEDMQRDVPRLILADNLHGIDIDLRATQIAALALWLRCQRAYQEMGLKKERPKIKRSNIVCAEPMPGEEQMLKEFVGQLEPKLLGQVVEVVFDTMKLAGEAGSLLKIEDEIRDAVAAAKKQWVREMTQATDRTGQPLLFTQAALDRIAGKPEQASLFDLSDITDAQFFEQAEAKVIEALRQYAEKTQNGRQLQRRLFAEDAVRGFAFVDLCQQRYDVVLMNPPFGESSLSAKRLIEAHYPKSKNDLFAVFIERGLKLLHRGGSLGAITSRTGFFLSSFQQWREGVLLSQATPAVFCDLGCGVLDTAMVETAAYCIEARYVERPMSFLRLLRAGDKEMALQIATAALHGSVPSADVFHVKPSAFEQVPESPFAYWATARVLRLFRELPPFDDESSGRATRCGLGTLDDFRFLRLCWEVCQKSIPTIWKPYYHGGVYSPIFDLFPLLVRWGNSGSEIKSFVEAKVGSASRKVQGEDHYFRPGFLFPRRTRAFSPKAMPAGGIFSTAGQAGFSPTEDLKWTLGLLSSKACNHLISLSQGTTPQDQGGTNPQYEVGLIKRLPWPNPPEAIRRELSSLVDEIYHEKATWAATSETSHLFVTPALRPELPSIRNAISVAVADADASQRRVSKRQRRIDQIAYELYGITVDDLPDASSESSEADEEIAEEDKAGTDPQSDASGITYTKSLVSYEVGCVFGRWDVRYSIGEMQKPRLLDPFAPLPICSPGTLQCPNGFPSSEAPAHYPLPINWDGILSDDPENSEDLVRCVRQVIEIVWKNRADQIEKEASQILGVKELREYFRKPGRGGFWDDHVSRYSKGRRKAPIYWLLQSSKKNYALWLYYHRLDKDLLFKALVNYVEPKIRLENSRFETLRSQKATAGESGKEAKRLAKEVERQEDFLSELRDFAEKLERAANLNFGDKDKLKSDVRYDPDLNDGVVLNIAPLHELVPWKEANSYWEELLEGKYEWSSIGKQLRQKGLVK